MNPLNQVNIEEVSTKYDISLAYHSDLMCQNYDAKIKAIMTSDGRVSFRPNKDDGVSFVFTESDPDRVIAIANMMMAFAQMVKNKNNKPIDNSDNA